MDAPIARDIGVDVLVASKHLYRVPLPRVTDVGNDLT